MWYFDDHELKHLSGYFPYNSGHLNIKNKTYSKRKIWNYILGSPHSSWFSISPGRVVSYEHTALSGYFPYNPGHFIKKLINRQKQGMKLYLGVTTFKSSGYLPRNSYIVSHHIWVDIFPIACILAKSSLILTLNERRFDLSFSWVPLLFWQSWGVSIEPKYVTTHPPPIQKQQWHSS
jgi:hypothetical protein